MIASKHLYHLSVDLHHEATDRWITYKYKIAFIKEEKSEGNGTYMQMTREGQDLAFNFIDLRFNTVYKPEAEIAFIALWANAYWDGKDGAYKLERINISRENNDG